MANKLTFAIAIKLMSDEFQKNASAVKNSLRSIQMQVVTFASALGVGALGLSSLISRFKDVSRETSRVTTALKNVSDGTKNFADNLSFINNLAKKYGLEVNALISNFASFTASANQANMPMKDQVKIFESLSKASTAFSLSSEQTDGVFLALTQMMGKGKISMEELRKQMGEKLPIAMSAMAKALGVSVAEMDKMVSSGKVMSADVLPKFAEALDGMIPEIDTDNLEASISRLSNAFRDVVDSSGFQNKYKALIDGLATLVRVAGDNIKTIVQGVISVVLGLVALGASKTLKTLWSTADQVTANQKRLTAIYESEGAKVVELERKIQAKRIQYIEASGAAQKRAYRDLVALQKERLAAVASQGKAQLAMETAMAEKVPGLWTRAFGMIKLGAIQLGLILKSLWSSFAPMIIITALTMVAQKIYEVVTKATALEEAQKRLTDAQSETTAEMAKEERKLDDLDRKLREAQKGSAEFKKIKDEIVNQYGQYFSGLDKEIDKVGNLSTAYDTLSDAIRRSVAERKFVDFKAKEDENLEKTIGDNLTKAYKSLTKSHGKAKGLELYEVFYDSAINGKELSVEDETTFKQTGMWSFAGQTIKYLNEIKEAKKAKDAILEEYKEINHIDGGNEPLIIHMPEKAQPKYSEDYKQKKDEWEKAKNELKAIEKDKAKFTTDQYKQAKENEKLAKTNFEELGGQTKGSKSHTPKDNTQKVIDNQLKLQNAKARVELDARNKELENQQALLDLEQDGFDKQQKQIDLNHKKEILGIDTRTQDLIEKQQEAERQLWDIEHPDTSKTKELFRTKTHSYTDLSDANKSELIQSDDIAGRKREKEEADLLKSLVEKYQDYNTRRVKLEKDYNEEIKFLVSQRNETNSTAIDAATAELIKQRDKALSSINLEEFQDSIDWSTVFGNLDRLSTNALEDIRGKLKTYLNEVGSSLSPTDLQTVTDAMEKMNLAIADRSPINELKSSYDDYRKALVDIIAAKEKLNGLEKGTAEYEQAKKNLKAAENARKASLIAMSQSLNSFGQKGNQLVNSGTEIIDMLSSFGVEIDENVSKTLAGVGQVMSGLENIDLTKPFSIVTSSITMLTGAGKAIAGIFGLFGGSNKDTKRYLEMKEQYESLNKVWDELINKKKEYISMSYGEEANKVGEEAKRLTEKQIESNRELGKAYMNSFKNKGGSSWGVRQQSRIKGDDWKDLAEWKRLNNISDELYKSVTTGRMTGLFDLTAEQLESLKEEAPSLWAKLEDQTKEYLNNIIDGADRLEDINKSLKEQYTQISLDSFKDNYIDLLSDMDSSNQDFADNFEKYIQKAILSSLIGSKYKAQIESLYDDFANANSDGNIDEAEMAILKKKQDNLAAQMIADRDKLKETFGWESDSSKSQDSSTKGYSVSMDQDTGGAILGRITGIHESIITLTSMVSGITMDTSKSLIFTISINDELKKQTEIFHEMRDIQTKTLTISKEVKESLDTLSDIKNDLASINKNTKGLAPR